MDGSFSLLEVYELLVLLPHHACGDVVGVEGVAKLHPRYLIVHGASGGVVGPPCAGVTTQLLRGEEGLLHLGAAQEPKFGLHHSKLVISLKRFSCLGEERQVSSREVTVGGRNGSISCLIATTSRVGHAATTTSSAHRGTQGSKRSLEPDSAVEPGFCSLGSSRPQLIHCGCLPSVIQQVNISLEIKLNNMAYLSNGKGDNSTITEKKQR
jgi:hypothetical protein